MRLLIDFYTAMMDRYKDNKNVGSVWHFNAYDTKFGSRQEISFVGHYITFIQMPVNLSLSLLVQHTTDTRVYKQAAFLMHEAMSYMTVDNENIYVSLHGQAYQAFTNMPDMYIEQVKAEGTIEGTDRFGNPKDIVLSKTVGVRVSKTHQINRV